MPVLPLGELGGSLERRARGDAKLTKTHQSGVQTIIIQEVIAEKGIISMGKNNLWKIKVKTSKVSYFYGRVECKMNSFALGPKRCCTGPECPSPNKSIGPQLRIPSYTTGLCEEYKL